MAVAVIFYALGRASAERRSEISVLRQRSLTRLTRDRANKLARVVELVLTPNGVLNGDIPFTLEGKLRKRAEDALRAYNEERDSL